MAPNLRQADLREISMVSGNPPEASLTLGVQKSVVCFTAVDDAGEPMAIFGALPSPLFEGVGVIWLLGTPAIETHRWWFLRESRAWMERFLDIWPVLTNFVYHENALHIRWLKWLGCRFLACHVGMGAGKGCFIEFVRVRDV